MRIFLFLQLIILLFLQTGCKKNSIDNEIRGCTDPNSINYNPNSTVDDGSCNYYDQNWKKQASGTVHKLSSVFFPTASVGYIVGDSGVLLKTTNAGNNWTLEYLSISSYKDLNSVFFTSRDTGWIVGSGGYNGGVILKTINAGQNWIKVNTTSINNLQCIYFLNSSIGWIGGYSGSSPTLLKTTNKGINWIGVNNPLLTISSVYFINQNIGWIVGMGNGGFGKIYKTIDGGLNWIEQNSNVSVNYFESVNFINQNTGWVSGGNYMLYTTNGGDNWNIIYTVASSNTISSIFIKNNRGYACGLRSLIMSNDNLQTWKKMDYFNITPNQFTSTFFIDQNIGWVVGYNGDIYKTTNSGGI